MESARGAPVQVWLIDLKRCAPGLAALDARQALLPAGERETLFKTTPLEGDFASIDPPRLIAHRALRLLIEHTFGSAWRAVPFVRDRVGGRPHLPGLAGDFNLSHASAWALVGLSSCGPIGVDLEESRPVRLRPDRALKLQHAAIDLAGGTPLPEVEGDAGALLQAWVRMEAAAKATGLGIGAVLSRSGVWGGGAGRTTEVAEGRGEAPGGHGLSQIRVLDLALAPGLHGAVALPAEIAHPPAVTLCPADPSALSALRERA